MRPPDLSIIIVNWNTAEFLRPCLNSIFIGPTRFAFEVLVVDNASYDGSAAMVGTHFPQVKFIQSGTNLGFAAANNLAFSCSQGRNILFLNPDTKIIGDALGSMLEVLVSAPQAGLVGPRLVNGDGSTQVGCVRSFPTLLNQLFDSGALHRRLFGPPFWKVKTPMGGAGRLLAAEAVPGACVMIKRELFERLGRFRESYFMYGEDVDLSYEAKRAGFHNYCVKDAVVVHYGGESSRQREAAFAPVLMRQSRADFLRAKRGRACAAAYRALTAVVAILRVLIIALLLMFSRNQPERQQRAAILKKWAKILRWTLGLEPWASRQTPNADSAVGIPHEYVEQKQT